MIKKNILLFSVVILALAHGLSAYAAEAPKWSIGTWWIIESQTYNSGGIKAGEENIGWEEKQAWRFEVSDTEGIDAATYYVVLIRPIHANPCPYVFRFWYRTTDLFVGRYEVLYPETADGIVSEATRAVRKDFIGTAPTPFVLQNFPNLPANISPLFLSSSSFSRTLPENPNQPETPGRPVQHIETVPADITFISDPRISSRLRNEEPTRRVRIQHGARSEQQYWNPQLPWSSYSESDGGSSLKRRTWLVDYGN
ncbi:MAG: hypothetical protein D3924_14470 [Candidatus Electrothrix sp. AR4]|nr:hypothetical protein [Candidatus Electrothrix sp. AR4]